MGKRLPNPRLAKIHRNYTVEETANLYDVHKNTVSNWIKHGLPVCGNKRPFLIMGRDLRVFLEAKKLKTNGPANPMKFIVCGVVHPKNLLLIWSNIRRLQQPWEILLLYARIVNPS